MNSGLRRLVHERLVSEDLARALEETAARRQVIVFTHDERLPEAVRRLGIESRMFMVARRPGSVVEVRKSLDPVRAHIEDALALVHTADLPNPVLRRTAPGFCRAAVEAALIGVIRRRQLLAGKSHGEVAETLAYPRLWNRQFPKVEGRSADQHDAWVVAEWTRATRPG